MCHEAISTGTLIFAKKEASRNCHQDILRQPVFLPRRETEADCNGGGLMGMTESRYRMILYGFQDRFNCF